MTKSEIMKTPSTGEIREPAKNTTAAYVEDDTSFYQLLEMFPDITPITIKNALTSAGNNIELAIQILLSDASGSAEPEGQSDSPTEEEKEQYKLDSLIQMFPDIDQNITKSYFDARDGQVEQATIDLLDFELLSTESVEDQKKVEERIKKMQKASADTAWDNYENNIKTIRTFTETDTLCAKKYYQDNHCNIIMAIIDIIHSGFKWKPTFSLKPIVKSINRPISRGGGRVQSAKGIAYAQKRSTTTIAQGSSTDNSTCIRPWSSKSFTYTDNSPEVLEIAEFVSTNVDFRSINPVFVKDVIIYYNGCVSEVIKLLLFIVTRRETKLTYMVDKSPFDGFIAANTLKTKNIPSAGTSRDGRGGRAGLKAHNSSMPCSDSRLEEKYLNDVLVTFRLDFHGLLPQQAANILKKALTIWWNEEIHKREFNCKRMNLVNVCCIQPLIIITGRGIHSAGGISKVRIQVKKALASSPFVYDEGASFFTIYGKKTS
mgnify:FL=1